MINVIKDFAVNSYSLEFLSNKYDLPIKDIIKTIHTFAEQTKSLKTSCLLKDRLAMCIVKDFMNYPQSAPEFAKKYGMTPKAFIEFILASINNTLLIPSDSLANAIYRRLVHKQIKIPINQIPDRIVNFICLIYVSDKKITASGLGDCYNVQGSFIPKIIRRGISEDIISDDLAERIYYKMNKCVSLSKESLLTLEQAFEQKEVTKIKKSITQLELMLESEDENVNYLKLQEALNKLYSRLSSYETNT